ncbi:MAG: hypothetical protein ACI3ZB_05375, partial [Prevotella sp.]
VAKHLSLSPSVGNMLAISILLFRDGDRRFGNRAETAQKQRFLMSMSVTAKIVCHPSVTMIRH